MRGSLGEIPDISKIESLYLISTKLIHGRDKDRSIVDKAPFGLCMARGGLSVPTRRNKCVGDRKTDHAMPMELPDRSLGEVLLGSSNVVARGEISDDLLTHPAASENSRLGVGEGPLEVGHHAVVCRLLAEVVRVLEVDLVIRSS